MFLIVYSTNNTYFCIFPAKMEFAKYANYQAFNTIFTSCIDVCISITIHLGFSCELFFYTYLPIQNAIYKMRIAHAIVRSKQKCALHMQFLAFSKSLYIHVFLLNNTYMHTYMHAYMHACKHSQQTEN